MTADQLFAAIKAEAIERKDARSREQWEILQMLRRIVARAERYEALESVEPPTNIGQEL